MSRASTFQENSKFLQFLQYLKEDGLKMFNCLMLTDWVRPGHFQRSQVSNWAGS